MGREKKKMGMKVKIFSMVVLMTMCTVGTAWGANELIVESPYSSFPPGIIPPYYSEIQIYDFQGGPPLAPPVVNPVYGPGLNDITGIDMLNATGTVQGGALIATGVGVTGPSLSVTSADSTNTLIVDDTGTAVVGNMSAASDNTLNTLTVDDTAASMSSTGGQVVTDTSGASVNSTGGSQVEASGTGATMRSADNRSQVDVENGSAYMFVEDSTIPGDGSGITMDSTMVALGSQDSTAGTGGTGSGLAMTAGGGAMIYADYGAGTGSGVIIGNMGSGDFAAIGVYDGVRTYGLTVTAIENTLDNNTVITSTDTTNTLTVDDSGTAVVGGLASDTLDVSGTSTLADTDVVGEFTVDTDGTATGGTVNVTDTAASMMVHNGTSAHGFSVNTSQAVMSGGLTSTTWTLSETGAVLSDSVNSTTFSVDNNGDTFIAGELDMNDNQIHNLAPGSVGTDAVNMNQLNDLEEDSFSGIAAVAAMAGIPGPLNGHNFALGLGGGNYKGENAVAAGFSANITPNMRMTGAVGYSADNVTSSVGVGFSW